MSEFGASRKLFYQNKIYRLSCRESKRTHTTSPGCQTKHRSFRLIAISPLALSAICGAPSPEAAVAAFLEVLPTAGFSAVIAVGWAGAPSTFVHRLYFDTIPEAARHLYAERGMFARDPLVALLRCRARPFLLTEEAPALRMTPARTEVIDMVFAFGWAEVLVVPIHGPGGYHGLVVLAANRTLTLDATARAFLVACAREVHDRCHDVPSYGTRVPSAPKLSSRQIQVLRGVAYGFSDEEIGNAHGLSPAAAYFHIEAAKRAMNVRTRTEAVAICALDGLL